MRLGARSSILTTDADQLKQQEVLDFCAKHNILPEVEMIRMQDINKAFDKMQDEEVHYRSVIDMQPLKES